MARAGTARARAGSAARVDSRARADTGRWFGRARALRPAASWLALLLLILLLPEGCTRSAIRGGPGAEADFLRGKKEFEEGHMLQAIQNLDAFRNEHPGSDRVDDAILLLGLAHARLGENVLARDEFDRLLRDYPQSDHREEAQFERAMTWLADSHKPSLDPEPTESALDAFRTYLRNYPEGVHREEAERRIRECLDRLATKAYLNGRTYMGLRQPEAAQIYFEKALGILPDFSKAADTLHELALAYEKTQNPEKARATWQKLVDFLTEERVKKNPRLEELRAKAVGALASSAPSK